jgi:membrane-bound lytic murein transglycosylase D
MLYVLAVGTANAVEGRSKPGFSSLMKVKDTAQTPTPAQTITTPIAPNTDLEAVMTNQAYTAQMIRLNPRAVTFVHDYMAKNSRDLEEIRDWALPYFNLMDKVFTKNGMPVELKYLAVVESQLKSAACSSAGAVGPWQLMPATARGLGLRVGKGKDERKDFYKSTNAAAKYLKALYAEFGDWLLVIAAYNGGPGYVYNAIKKSHSRNFWDLQYYLPTESRNHVKKFISTHYIFEGQGGITTLTNDEATEQIGALAGYMQNRNLTGEELNNSSTTTISGKYRAVVISKYINMDIEDFNRYNPYFDKIMDEADGTYSLKLPSGQMEMFIANRYPILSESVHMLLENNISVVADVPSKKIQATAVK